MTARRQGAGRQGPGRGGAEGQGAGRQEAGRQEAGRREAGSPGGGPARTPLRVLGHLLLLVTGALVGLAGALVQAGWFPGGLLLAVGGLAALCYGGVRATGTRLGGAAAAAGWLAIVLFLTASRPEGDFLFGAGLGSYVFLLGGMLTAVMCVTMPKLSQPGGRAGGPTW